MEGTDRSWQQTASMPAVLVTGMSAVGKSTVLAELGRRGFKTVDTDEGGWIEVVDGEPLWRLSLIDELLSRVRDRPLFVQGTVANQRQMYDRFHAVVLLTAPVEVIFERLRTRTTNSFGRTESERRRIARDIVEVEPLLRAGATHEIDTTRPLTDVVETLVRIAAEPHP